MNLKLDENFGTRLQELFRQAGHDVHTVRDESLQGVTDETVLSACASEQRCLITLDLDFANVLRFPPTKTAGIVVFRLPSSTTLLALENLARRFLSASQRHDVRQTLWIVEPGRIRVHQDDQEEGV